MINEKFRIEVGGGDVLSSCLSFINETLKSMNINRKLMLRSSMLSEELLIHFLENADEGSCIEIRVRKYLGDATINITSKGDKLDLIGASELEADSILEMEDDEVEQAFRAILLKSNKDNFKYSYSRGKNKVRINVGQSEQSMLVMTVTALVLGLAMGLLMNFVLPSAVSDGISTYLLVPFKTMFMNSLKIVIAPVVFFSIVSCVSGFKDLSELGRIGLKVMGMYISDHRWPLPGKRIWSKCTSLSPSFSGNNNNTFVSRLSRCSWSRYCMSWCNPQQSGGSDRSSWSCHWNISIYRYDEYHVQLYRRCCNNTGCSQV